MRQHCLAPTQLTDILSHMPQMTERGDEMLISGLHGSNDTKLLRKLDFKILLCSMVLFLLAFLDKWVIFNLLDTIQPAEF
jgi:hypothetical protein